MKHEESDPHGKFNPLGHKVGLMKDYCMTVLVIERQG